MYIRVEYMQIRKKYVNKSKCIEPIGNVGKDYKFIIKIY